MGKVEKQSMKKGAEGQFYEILEDICDRCHSNVLLKKTHFFIKNMYDTIVWLHKIGLKTVGHLMTTEYTSGTRDYNI